MESGHPVSAMEPTGGGDVTEHEANLTETDKNLGRSIGGFSSRWPYQPTPRQIASATSRSQEANSSMSRQPQAYHSPRPYGWQQHQNQHQQHQQQQGQLSHAGQNAYYYRLPDRTFRPPSGPPPPYVSPVPPSYYRSPSRHSPSHHYQGHHHPYHRRTSSSPPSATSPGAVTTPGRYGIACSPYPNSRSPAPSGCYLPCLDDETERHAMPPPPSPMASSSSSSQPPPSRRPFASCPNFRGAPSPPPVQLQLETDAAQVVSNSSTCDAAALSTPQEDVVFGSSGRVYHFSNNVSSRTPPFTPSTPISKSASFSDSKTPPSPSEPYSGPPPFPAPETTTAASRVVSSSSYSSLQPSPSPAPSSCSATPENTSSSSMQDSSPKNRDMNRKSDSISEIEPIYGDCGDMSAIPDPSPVISDSTNSNQNTRNLAMPVPLEEEEEDFEWSQFGADHHQDWERDFHPPPPPSADANGLAKSNGIHKESGDEDDISVPFTPKNGIIIPKRQPVVAFPDRLRRMLDEASARGFDHIVSWHEDGKSFRVHDPQLFVTDVAIKTSYFNQSKYKSFQRQLNLYGFERFTKGPRRGGYAHPHFVRDDPSAPRLVRLKESKASFDKKRPKKLSELVNLEVEPIGAVVSDESTCGTSSNGKRSPRTSSVHEFTNVAPTMFDEYGDGDADSIGMLEHALDPLAEGDDFDLGFFPNDELPHIDFGQERNKDEPEVQQDSTETARDNLHLDSPGFAPNKPLLAHSFPWRVYDMLQDAETHGFAHVVSWCSSSSFKVHNHEEFVSRIMPRYFGGQHHYESFRRQLNAYGFVRTRRGPNRGIYTHELMERGKRATCYSIRRVTTK